MTGDDEPAARDRQRRTRRIARLLVWTGVGVALGAVVGLVHVIHPLVT